MTAMTKSFLSGNITIKANVIKHWHCFPRKFTYWLTAVSWRIRSYRMTQKKYQTRQNDLRYMSVYSWILWQALLTIHNLTRKLDENSLASDNDPIATVTNFPTKYNLWSNLVLPDWNQLKYIFLMTNLPFRLFNSLFGIIQITLKSWANGTNFMTIK